MPRRQLATLSLSLSISWGLSSMSCRSVAPEVPAAARPATQGDAIELLIGKDLRAAQELGASDPRLGLSGAGISGDSLGGFLSLPRDECALVLARGSSAVQDLDLFAFADDGSILGSDESAARDANLLLCPPLPSRAFVSGRVAAGFGLFAVSAQALAPDRAPALARRFGVFQGNSATAPQELETNWPGLDERLAAHRRRLGGRWESLRKVALPLDPRLYVNVSTSVNAGNCVDVLVMPSNEVVYLELEALEPNGRWIGSGEARGADRDLMVCSSETRELNLRCRPHGGRGLAALVISRLSSGTGAELGSHAARFDLRPEGTLEQLRAANAAQLARSGYGKATFFRDGQLAPDRRTSLSLPLARGCARIDVLSAAPVQSLRAWLWDPAGRLLAEELQGISSTLFACGAATNARLDLETLSRGGAFTVEVRQGAVLPALTERYRLAVSRLLKLMATRGHLRSLSELPQMRVSEVSENTLSREQLRVSAGHCLEFSAALDEQSSGLELRLFESGTGTTGEAAIDDAEMGYGAHAASARICAVKPARDRVLTAELRANVGRGMALWASHEFDPDPSVKGPRAH
jgi:hypothetical protein